MKNFTQIPDLCPALKINLEKNGFVETTPVQEQAIPPALEGRDIVATAQTGTGKTLGFALPIVQKLSVGPTPKGIRAIILSPTRELAIQINETIGKLTVGMQIRSAVVVGGMNEGNQLRAIKKGAQIIVATPGRLCDFVERRLVDLKSANIFVLDEADRMLDMGFLPSIRAILQHLPAVKQTLLFSATIEKSVEHLIEASVKNPVRITIGAMTKPVEMIDLHHYEVEAGNKLPLLQHLLRTSEGTFLVFARTKRATDRLATDLQNRGVKAARIHGDRTQGQRNQALAGFKNGSYRVLVATDVAARGIHVDGIAHVVNYDLPQVPEDFVHRVGRTGRAGAKGTATTFSFRSERQEILRIERSIKMKMQKRDVPSDLKQTMPLENVPQRTEPQPKVIVIPIAKVKAIKAAQAAQQARKPFMKRRERFGR